MSSVFVERLLVQRHICRTVETPLL